MIREGSFDTDIDHKSAFDDRLDLALHETTVFVDFDDLVPVLLVSRFLFGKNDHTFVVLQFFEKNFDLVSYCKFFVLKFGIGMIPSDFALISTTTTCGRISMIFPRTIEFRGGSGIGFRSEQKALDFWV